MSGTNGNGTGRGPGRPKGTTRVETEDAFREQLFEALATYESKSAACASVGITYQTFRNWLEKAWKATDGFWANFFVAYMRARAPFWEIATKRLSNRSPEIILANECPDEWNTARKVEVSFDSDPFDFLRDPEVTDALDRSLARRAACRPMAEPGSPGG